MVYFQQGYYIEIYKHRIKHEEEKKIVNEVWTS